MYTHTVEDGYLEGPRRLDECLARRLCFQKAHSRLAPQGLGNTAKSLQAVDRP